MDFSLLKEMDFQKIINDKPSEANTFSAPKMTPQVERKIEIPISKNKISATYNTDGRINKLVTIFASHPTFSNDNKTSNTLSDFQAAGGLDSVNQGLIIYTMIGKNCAMLRSHTALENK